MYVHSLICGILNSQTNRIRVEWGFPETGQTGKWGDVGQRV